MKNSNGIEVEQRVSKGVTEKVDNFVLQMILTMVKDAKIKADELIVFQLNKCPHCQKQRIFLEDAEDRDCDNQICIFCEKPADERVVVYQYEPGEQIICLEAEAQSKL